MGIKAAIARRLGCSWITVDRAAKKHPAVQEALENEREQLLDLAEANLVRMVERGEWPAIRYVLSTLGKSRGYGTGVEQPGVDAELPLQITTIEVVMPADAGDRWLTWDEAQARLVLNS